MYFLYNLYFFSVKKKISRQKNIQLQFVFVYFCPDFRENTISFFFVDNKRLFSKKEKYIISGPCKSADNKRF